jgi:hypothetical protein
MPPTLARNKKFSVRAQYCTGKSTWQFAVPHEPGEGNALALRRLPSAGENSTHSLASPLAGG